MVDICVISILTHFNRDEKFLQDTKSFSPNSFIKILPVLDETPEKR